MSANGFKYNSHYAFGTLMVLFFLLPLWMSIYWYLSPNRKLVVAIIDKSLYSEQGKQHVSLKWVLGQEKFSKTNKQQYQQTKDYFGFFSSDKEKFVLKGLEQFSANQLEQLSKDADLAYFTNSYGVFKNDAHGQADQGNSSFLQQTGMSSQDFQLLSSMKSKGKLVIVEFNATAPPTSPQVRSDFELLFGIKWTGWIGRYFYSFDSSKNKELPEWLIKDYKSQHKGIWPFKKGGIAFVHSDKRIVILEEEIDLTSPYPEIVANSEGVTKFHLKESTTYTYWFDIMDFDQNTNHAAASFNINTNDKGAAVLANAKIPSSFPAVTLHQKDDYQFFYLSTDFSENPIGIKSAYFKGMKLFKPFLYNSRDRMDRRVFFWEIYQPLLTNILNDYYNSKYNTQLAE
jgi:hypothetical protein